MNPTLSPPEVILYTDGACSGNPGPGGWAFILEHVPSGKTREASGAWPETTNNQMELQAVIEGLQALRRTVSVQVVTDSSYVEQGLRDWSPRWKANGWRRKTASGMKPVKNLAQWKELDQLAGKHDLHLKRIKGHAGHAQNERCDELAVNAYKKLMGRS